MKLALLTALSLSAVTFGASAQTTLVPTEHQPSFDYVQAAYLTYNIDDSRNDLDGFALRGSHAFNEQLFAAVSYEDVSTTDSIAGYRLTINLRQLYANLGYQFYQQGNMSLYASGGLAWVEVEGRNRGPEGTGISSNSDTGYNLQLGLRHRFNQYLEIDANVRHVDIDGSTDQLLTFAGRYYVTTRFSVDARYTRLDSDVSNYSIGASFHF